jgi:hypothetical protein
MIAPATERVCANIGCFRRFGAKRDPSKRFCSGQCKSEAAERDRESDAIESTAKRILAADGEKR